MLYVLTGNVQTGKSRWLERRVKEMMSGGVTCYGVISAGIWIESDSKHANEQGFEKLGIESILLPQMERFEFAKRVDLSKQDGSFKSQSQAGKAGLGWHISDEALARVNAHFAHIAHEIETGSAQGILIVDELGRLEIDHGQGLTEAMKILEAGARDDFPNALVTVRSTLVEQVTNRFADAWEGAQNICIKTEI